MSGMRLLNESTYWWVWSHHGPADNGTNYGRTFVNGMIPCPIPGDCAQEMESFGYTIEEYVPGTWFSHWEKEPESFRQRPVFKPIATECDCEEPGFALVQPEFPPAELPEKLPDSWVEFFSHYTAGGKLKREYRG